MRIKGTARTPDVLLSTPVGMKVPKRSSTSRKLLLDGNEEHFAKGNVGEDDDEEYEWKVVCWIDSKVRWEVYLYIDRFTTCLYFLYIYIYIYILYLTATSLLLNFALISN